MNPRALAVLTTLVLVVSGVSATAAFTAVSAERAVTVEVVGDADQLLGLEPHDGPNGKYAYQDGDELLVVDVSSTNPNGDVRGVGKRTATTFDDVFDVRNNGPQPVFVWIDSSALHEFTFNFHTSCSAPLASACDAPGAGPRVSVTGRENAVELLPGETLPVGFVIRTSADAEDRLAGTIVIHASTTVDPDAPDER